VANQAEDLRNAYAKVKTVYQQRDLPVSSSEGARVSGLLSKADAATKSWKAKVAGYVATAHRLATQAATAADAADHAVC
jgi:hypothetical protein